MDRSFLPPVWCRFLFQCGCFCRSGNSYTLTDHNLPLTALMVETIILVTAYLAFFGILGIMLRA